MNTRGEVIEEPPSKIAILAHHFGGLIGVLTGIIFLILVIMITFVPAFEQDFLTETWEPWGFTIIMSVILVDLSYNGIKLIYGQVKFVKGVEVIDQVIGTVLFVILYLLYPFDFGDLNPLIKTAMIILAILKGFTALEATLKFFTWEERDNKSFHFT